MAIKFWLILGDVWHAGYYALIVGVGILVLCAALGFVYWFRRRRISNDKYVDEVNLVYIQQLASS